MQKSTHHNVICYVAGKSGGHIVPALTLASRGINPTLFFTTDSVLDAQIVQNNPAVAYWYVLRLSNFPRKNLLKYPKFIGQFLRACWQSFWKLRQYAPKKVVSLGGYISIPVCLMAWILRIPIELYELNVQPGAAIKLLAHFAQTLNIVFLETEQYFKRHTTVVEYPVRFTDAQIDKNSARKQLELVENIPTLLILGGSQGSAFINTLAQQLLTTLIRTTHVQVIHQVGEKHVKELQAYYAEHTIKAIVFAYRNDLDVCYAAADLAIARAGAGTLFELLYFKVPSVIIPLETSTTQHQLFNAMAMAHRSPQLFNVIRQSMPAFIEPELLSIVQGVLSKQ